MMIVIGLTGGVGTGKSTVAKMFKQLGAVVLDADALAHQAIEPKRIAWRRIVKVFGTDVLNADQTVNRRRLASLVFSDEPRRRQLERIIHPVVLREIKRALHRLRRLPALRTRGRGTRQAGARGIKAVVLDVPLLLEVGAAGLVDALVVVTAPPQAQRERLQRTHGWSDEETTARIAAQWELSAKAALADYVVDNSNGVDATRTQVRQLWKQLVPANRPSSTSQR